MNLAASISHILMLWKEVSFRQLQALLLAFLKMLNTTMLLVSYWKTPTYNSPYMNWKRGMYCMFTGLAVIEPIRHYHANMTMLNQFYEWPRTRMEANIFFKEVFRMPDFWPELAKK